MHLKKTLLAAGVIALGFVSSASAWENNWNSTPHQPPAPATDLSARWDGYTYSRGDGIGDKVKAFAIGEELGTLEFNFDAKGDPRCTGRCGDGNQHFTLDFDYMQTVGAGVLAESAGHGHQSAAANTITGGGLELRFGKNRQ